MKISSKARHAIQSMIQLALSVDGQPVTLHQLTAEQKISSSYMEQLLAALRLKGLVTGTRGPGGGYRLGKPAEAIDIGEILLVVHDGQLVRDPHPDEENAQFFRMWCELSRLILHYLQGITLADLMEDDAVQAHLHIQRLVKDHDVEVKSELKKA